MVLPAANSRPSPSVGGIPGPAAAVNAGADVLPKAPCINLQIQKFHKISNGIFTFDVSKM